MKNWKYKIKTDSWKDRDGNVIPVDDLTAYVKSHHIPGYKIAKWKIREEILNEVLANPQREQKN